MINVDDNSVQLPPGFTLNETPKPPRRAATSASSPALPPGFTLNTPESQPQQPAQPKPMTRAESNAYLTGLATHGAGTWQPPRPAFTSTRMVDPEAAEFGGPIQTISHPSFTQDEISRGMNLVPIEAVPHIRKQLEFDAANPDLVRQRDAAAYNAWKYDPSVPMAERMRRRAGTHARQVTEETLAMDAANNRWLQYAGGKGADAAEAFGDFMARHFTSEPGDESGLSPTERGIARSVGKNTAQVLANPITYATLPLGVAGKAGQVALSGLFAVGATKQSYDAAGELGSIWDRQDISRQQKVEAGTDLILNTITGGMAGAHTVKAPFMRGNESFLSSIPAEDRAAVTQRFNSILESTGGVLSKAKTAAGRAASTVGDVMAEVANTDRENIPPTPVRALRRSLPKIQTTTARTALPLVRAVADNAGLDTVTAADLLDTPPDKNGNTGLGLIGQAKNEVLAQADAAAGQGRTINDLSPAEIKPYLDKLDALDDLHDHLQQGLERETVALKRDADTGKIPQTKAAALVRMGLGMGKIAISTSAGPALGRVSRVLLHVYGIPSGFNDLVTGVKGLIGAGGKLSPELDINLNDALRATQPAFSEPTFGSAGEVRQPAAPYTGDLSVQHESTIAPPELPHGYARVAPDVPNPRFQLSSGTTNPAPRGSRTANAPLDQPARTFTSVPQGVTPELEPKQIPLPQAQPRTGTLERIVRGQGAAQPEINTNPNDVIVPRGQHPEEIVTNWLQRSKKQDVFNVAKQLGIETSAADSHQTLIPQIIDRLDEEGALGAMAEHAQGLRGEILPSGERPPVQDTNLMPQLEASVERANARKAAQEPRPLADIVRGPERRQAANVDLRSRFEQMSPEQRTQALMEAHQRERTSALTGLPNLKAFEESAQEIGGTHPNVGYADVDGFKQVNDALGHDGADAVLGAIGKLFNEAQAEENGAVASFHRSGDEFLFRSSDPEAIGRVVNRVNAALAKTKFTFTDSAGREVEQRGIGLSHGVGTDETAAEAAAAGDKQLRKQQGLRTGSRDTAPVQSVDRDTPARAEAQVNNVPGRNGVSSEEAAQPANVPEQQPELRPFSSRGGVSDADFEAARQRMRDEASGGFGGLFTPDTTQRPMTRVADLRPGDAAMVPTSDLKADPSRFQYKKTDIGEGGVTNALKDQRRYDQNKGGVLLVWRDPADGNTYVVNGHHRFELAQRANEPGVLVRMIPAESADEAKVVGAETNIAEGHGSIVDAARFFKAANIRTPQDAAARDLPLGQAKVTDGLAMARLDDSILDRVEAGTIPEGRAVAIGRITDNPAQQDATLQAIAKAESRSGKTLTNGEAESIARQVRDASTHMEQGQDLFGSFNREHSLFGEQAAIDDYVLRQIRTDKRTFGAVASKSRAETLSKVQGQQINAAENQRISEQAAQAEQIYNRLINRAGVLHDLRTNAAKELSNRYSKPQDVKAKAYEAIRNELQRQLGSMNMGTSESARP